MTKKGHKHHMHQNMSEFAKEHRSVKCNTRWRRQYYSVWSKLNEISAIVLVQYIATLWDCICSQAKLLMMHFLVLLFNLLIQNQFYIMDYKSDHFKECQPLCLCNTLQHFGTVHKLSY